jgi:hypothetical protein
MNDKNDYLVKELWISAWNASVQHSGLYRKGLKPNSEKTRIFRETLIGYLSSQVIPRYNKEGLTEEQHYGAIDGVVAFANDVGEAVLGPAGYKYGVAQKLLNLILKYYWCLGEVAEPPHCPVDRIVISMTRHRGKNWTQITQRADYQMIIEDIKRLAGSQSIAMWELCTFRRR